MVKPRGDGIARFAAVSVALVAAAASGCGGGEERTQPTQATSPPLGRAPSATAPPDAGSAATDARRPPREPAAPGGSHPVRVPATFTLRDGRLTPRTVSIPPFLAIEVSVAATDGRPHAVTISADRTYRLQVPEGKRASLVLPGQAPGRYAVTSGDARATLVVGGEPGP